MNLARRFDIGGLLSHGRPSQANENVQRQEYLRALLTAKREQIVPRGAEIGLFYLLDLDNEQWDSFADADGATTIVGLLEDIFSADIKGGVDVITLDISVPEYDIAFENVVISFKEHKPHMTLQDLSLMTDMSIAYRKTRNPQLGAKPRLVPLPAEDKQEALRIRATISQSDNDQEDVAGESSNYTDVHEVEVGYDSDDNIPEESIRGTQVATQMVEQDALMEPELISGEPSEDDRSPSPLYQVSTPMSGAKERNGLPKTTGVSGKITKPSRPSSKEIVLALPSGTGLAGLSLLFTQNSQSNLVEIVRSHPERGNRRHPPAAPAVESSQRSQLSPLQRLPFRTSSYSSPDRSNRTSGVVVDGPQYHVPTTMSAHDEILSTIGSSIDLQSAQNPAPMDDNDDDDDSDVYVEASEMPQAPAQAALGSSGARSQLPRELEAGDGTSIDFETTLPQSGTGHEGIDTRTVLDDDENFDDDEADTVKIENVSMFSVVLTDTGKEYTYIIDKSIPLKGTLDKLKKDVAKDYGVTGDQRPPVVTVWFEEDGQRNEVPPYFTLEELMSSSEHGPGTHHKWHAEIRKEKIEFQLVLEGDSSFTTRAHFRIFYNSTFRKAFVKYLSLAGLKLSDVSFFVRRDDHSMGVNFYETPEEVGLQQKEKIFVAKNG